ncbi:GGDEF domain-containing protein [Formicincola oecophyllae]|uniref:GGDEF domain-containing protein n=1 Tax=Formicincola oecophyllae TaxID=2558361 RepID=A0A4Y6UCQ5_9PROT|nr:GGDEF domain-containing protein [Formicincola oecophyllae]QDH13895.2 GGDEF domain-containing protein [Formicincola oecophyllae]
MIDGFPETRPTSHPSPKAPSWRALLPRLAGTLSQPRQLRALLCHHFDCSAAASVPGQASAPSSGEATSYLFTLPNGQRVLLKRPASAPWSAGERAKLEATEAFLEQCHQQQAFQGRLQQSILGQVRHEPGSGLLTGPAFNEELDRRLARLDFINMAGTLMMVQVNGLFKAEDGPATDQAKLRQTVSVLKNAVRPTDLVGRLGANLFMLWMDGGDRFAASERAAWLTGICQMSDGGLIRGPEQDLLLLGVLPAHECALQIGLACREASSGERAAELVEQAALALRQTDPLRLPWRFARTEDCTC